MFLENPPPHPTYHPTTKEIGVEIFKTYNRIYNQQPQKHPLTYMNLGGRVSVTALKIRSTATCHKVTYAVVTLQHPM